MSKLKAHLTKEQFNSVMALYARQSWIMEREENFLELFLMCGSPENKELILNLLSDFYFLNDTTIKKYLDAIADFIINDSGFKEESTQIASLTWDDEADSSQSILQGFKLFLFQKNWSNIKTVNKFGDIFKNHKKGKTQIILIDEFVGSGKTIMGRIDFLEKNVNGPFELICCFQAGMKHGIDKIIARGYKVFCTLTLDKGIEEKYKTPEKEAAIERMKSIESKLAEKINENELIKYSFGYNDAQALYSAEGQLGNTPNSVFPAFWWPRLKNGDARKTLLTRFEKGLK